MDFRNIIKNKNSIREFKEKGLDRKTIDKLLKYVNDIEPLQREIYTDFHFIEEGHRVHDFLLGNAGYHGMAIDAPHYLLLLSEKKPHYLKNAGYIMEQILIKAYALGLGSCWIDVIVGIDKLKKELGIAQKGEIAAMAALGYSKTNIFGIETSVANRESMEELVYKEEWGQSMDLEEFRQWGLEDVFYYARHAPSWGNIQPWKFILDEDKLILTILQKDPYILEDSKDKNHELDCGIIMLYVEKMMHQQGIKGKWKLDMDKVNEEKYNIPDEYRIAGYFPI